VAVISFNVAAISAMIPSVSESLGISPFVAGRAIWLYMIPYGITALVFGPLTNRFDIKKIKLVCLSIFAISSFLSGISKTAVLLFVSRFLGGLVASSIVPIGLIMIADNAQDNKKGRLVGRFFAAGFASSLFGIFLSGIVSWRTMFFIPGILGLVLVSAILKYMPNYKPHLANFKTHYKAAFADSHILRVFLYIFIVSFLYHGIRQWLGVYLFNRYQMTQFLISLFITFTALSGIFGEISGGYLADKIGRIFTLKAGVIFLAISVIILNFKPPLFVVTLVMLLYGFGWTLNHSGLSTILTDMPKRFRAEVAGLNSSIRFLSGGMSVALSGFFMKKYLLGTFFIYGVLFLVLAVLTDKILRTS